MKLLKSLLLGLVLGVGAGLANANVISLTHNIQASGPASLGYTAFNVSADDTVSMYTGGNAIDPVLFLFRWDGHLDLADFVAYNDDCSGCSASGGWNNAGISQFLTAGSYMAVVGDFALSINDALLGVGNTGNTAFGVKTGDVQLVLSAERADLTDPPVSAVTVAEPGTPLLLGIALIALALVRFPLRRRRR